MALTQQHTLVEHLCARWYINCRVLIEEVNRLEVNTQFFAWHDWEILDSGDVVDAELNPNDNVVVLDVVFTRCPCSNTGAATRLVGVPTSSVKFAVAMLGDKDVVGGEFGALVVER